MGWTDYFASMTKKTGFDSPAATNLTQNINQGIKMENTLVPKEKSQSAMYFKYRQSIGKFTTPLPEDNPAGVYRAWTHPKTGDKGKTWELQTERLTGTLIDARIHSQEFDEGRKETSLLLSLEEFGVVRVLKLPVKSTKGLSKDFSYFAMRCEGIDPELECVFEIWTPPSAQYPVILYKQNTGAMFPTTRKSKYAWNEETKGFDGLPDIIVTEDFSGEKEYNSKERDKYLYGLVEAFCERTQAKQKEREAKAASAPRDTAGDDEEDLPW